MRRSSLMRVVALILTALMALLAGCSSQPAAPTAAKVPARVTIAFGADVTNLDPHDGVNVAGMAVSWYIHDQLWEFDPGSDTPKPRLATSWQFDASGKELTIKLRKGVVFHDGEPFNAEALKFNFDRLTSTKAPVKARAGLDKAVVETKVIDGETLLLRLNKPFAPILRIMSNAPRGIVSPKALKTHGKDYGLKADGGSGPFRVKEWVRGDRIVLEKNKQFWGDAPKIDEIIFKSASEANTRTMMLEAGDAMVADKIPPTDVERLKKVANIEVRRDPSDRVYYVALLGQGEDGKKLPYADPKVRQAMNLAINKQDVLKLFAGYATEMDSPLAKTMFGYAATKTFPFDQPRAKALLAEAGYANGFSTTLITTSGYYPLDKAVAETLQAQLAQIGVQLKIVPMELASYVDLLFAAPGKAKVPREMIFRGFSTEGALEPGAQSILIKDGWPPAQLNVSFYANPKVDELHYQGLATYDVDKRKGIYREMQKLVMDDTPWLFLYNADMITAVNKKLKGVVVYPSDLIDLRTAWVE